LYKRVSLITLLLVIFVVAVCSLSFAENWPVRPINTVIGYGAGGFTDLVNRYLADGMSKVLGVPIAVSNMPGGSGGIAAEYVYRAPHNGYLLLGVADSLRIQAVMGFHPTTVYKEWQPLIAASFDGVISVGKDSPYKSFDQIIKDLREKPESLTLAASSPGTTWHIQSKIMERDSGLKFNFIPYPGSYPAQVAAIAGDVDVVHTGLGEQIDLIKSGELRPLAIFSDKAYNIEGYYEIPPITQFLPEVDTKVNCWIGLAFPSDTPEEIKDKLEEAFNETVNSDRFKDFVINELNGNVITMDAEESLEFVKQQTSIVSWMMVDIGLTTESPEKFGIPKQ